jgi:sec-independent protein translocase protein TatA
MFEGLLQPMHLLVIFGIALLVFGPKKLPELGKGIGDGIRGFKLAMKEDDADSLTGQSVKPKKDKVVQAGEIRRRRFSKESLRDESRWRC